jgi:CRP/FNR family transcriptional regulator, anaerobic regulatory protein
MPENNELVQSLRTIYRFNDEQVAAFLQKLSVRTLSKNDYLLSAGMRCDFMAFLVSGSIRFYSLTESNDFTLHFFTENGWVADYESFISQQPSRNYLQAMESTCLQMISLDALHELIDRYPVFRNLASLMKEWIVTTSHLTSIASSSPDDRYKLLLSSHPDWINRFPQMHIASYLGMTKETLSRVKVG